MDEGPKLAPLLCEAVFLKIAPDYVKKLLAAFPVLQTNQTADAKSSQTFIWIDRASLVTGKLKHSDSLLKVSSARDRFHTCAFVEYVKTHIRNIYDKLGVNT